MAAYAGVIVNSCCCLAREDNYWQLFSGYTWPLVGSYDSRDSMSLLGELQMRDVVVIAVTAVIVAAVVVLIDI